MRRRRRLSRRRIGLAAGIGFGVLLVLAGWTLYDGLAAKSQLQTVRDEVHQLRTEISAGDLDAARATAAKISSHASDAKEDVSGPVWSAAAAVPFLGRPLRAARTMTSAVDEIAASALPSLIDASKSLDPKTLRGSDGSIALAPIEDVAPVLDRAAATMRSALARINALPSSSWLGVVDSARSDAIKQLTPLTHTVESIDVAADSLPTLLGAHGAKHYMVTFENEAELRGTGGLPGAFAIVEADNGRLSFTQFEPDSTLDDVKSGLDFGPDFAQTYDAPDVTGDYRDANVSPNFPYAARIWLAEWKAKSGQTLDGAITMDPTALSYLLRVTGPAVLPDNTKVNANNVVQLTQQAVYAKFARDENSQRKQYLLDIARAVSQRLIATHGNTTALVRAAGRAASERRLLVWVTDPAIEARLAATTIGGAVPVTPAPYAAVTINNAGGNKIDYYLHAAVTWAASGCGQARRVTVTITLTNDAPADLPALVLGFTGRPGFPQNPGDNALVVSFYGTAGGALDGVLLNNDQSTASSGRELGHPVYAVHLPIGRGTTQTITFDLTEPGTGVPALRLQPMVNPMTGAATAASCN